MNRYYLRFLPLIFLLLGACGNNNVDEKVELKKFFNEVKRISQAATNLNILNDSILNSIPITRPLGTRVNLIEFETYGENFQKKKYCLSYKNPTSIDSKDGVLLLVRNSCQDKDIKKRSEEKNDLFKISSLSFLKITKDNDLNISTDRSGYNFSLLNISKEKKTKLFLDIAPNGYSDKLIPSGEACLVYDKKCNKKIDLNCGSCENGIEYSLTSFCPGKRNIYCGQKECGKKNQRACFRGLGWNKKPLIRECFPDNPIGFCNKGLNIYCNNKGELICL